MASGAAVSFNGTLPIGSKARWLRHLALLLVASIVILGLLYYLIEGALGEPLLAAIVLLGAVLGAFIRRALTHALPEWVRLFMKDSAFGTVGPEGIRYYSLRGWHSLTWQNVRRIDYWPQNQNRLDIYAFSRGHALWFGPTTDPVRTLQFIQHQLHQFGTKVEINIREGKPGSPYTLPGLTKSQKWLARIVVVVVFAVHESYWWINGPRPHKFGYFVVVIAEAAVIVLLLALLRSESEPTERHRRLRAPARPHPRL